MNNLSALTISCFQGSHGDGDKVPDNEVKNKNISTEYKLSHKDGASIPCVWFRGDLSSSVKLNATRSDWVVLFERGSELKELRKHIATVRINSSQVTSMWGMPGVGKSAIVRNLYYDKLHNSDQYIKYGWVDVSHPFNLRDFSGSLLFGMHSVSLQTKDACRATMRIKDPIQECHMFLKKYPCLVVINNLQSTEEWDLIEASLVSRPSKTVIVVLTTEASIAAHCAHSKEDVLNVKGLDAEASFSLFRKKVCLLTGNFKCSSYFNSIFCFPKK
jgi:hypothetical protein